MSFQHSPYSRPSASGGLSVLTRPKCIPPPETEELTHSRGLLVTNPTASVGNEGPSVVEV